MFELDYCLSLLSLTDKSTPGYAGRRFAALGKRPLLKEATSHHLKKKATSLNSWKEKQRKGRKRSASRKFLNEEIIFIVSLILFHWSLFLFLLQCCKMLCPSFPLIWIVKMHTNTESRKRNTKRKNTHICLHHRSFRWTNDSELVLRNEKSKRKVAKHWKFRWNKEDSKKERFLNGSCKKS